jgi:4a-hydroxytetrahydrobiopterin dehydratase
MSEGLTTKSCVPCRGGIPPLPGDAVQRLLREVPSWEPRDADRRIERSFAFRDFAEAFRFVTKVVELAEAENHHPDITFGWGYATVSFHTHKIEGLHENDFVMAAKVDRILAS